MILRDVAPHLLHGDAQSQSCIKMASGPSCKKLVNRGNLTRALTKENWRFRYASEPKWQLKSRSEIVVEFGARATQVRCLSFESISLQDGEIDIGTTGPKVLVAIKAHAPETTHFFLFFFSVIAINARTQRTKGSLLWQYFV